MDKELFLADEVIEKTLEEYAKILEVKFNPLVYYVIGDLLDQLLAKVKQRYEAAIQQTIKDDADRCAGYMESAREEAKREGEERILKLAIENDILCSHIEAQEVNCKTCLAFWQALGEK